MARAQAAIPLQPTGELRRDLVDMALSVKRNLDDPTSRAVGAASLSSTAESVFGDVVSQFRALRLPQAAGLVEDAQEDGRFDRAADPRTVVERVVAPIWFRTFVTKEAVDREFIECAVDAALCR